MGTRKGGGDEGRSGSRRGTRASLWQLYGGLHPPAKKKARAARFPPTSQPRLQRGNDDGFFGEKAGARRAHLPVKHAAPCLLPLNPRASTFTHPSPHNPVHPICQPSRKDRPRAEGRRNICIDSTLQRTQTSRSSVWRHREMSNIPLADPRRGSRNPHAAAIHGRNRKRG